jgi:hypothetical protein
MVSRLRRDPRGGYFFRTRKHIQQRYLKKWSNSSTRVVVVAAAAAAAAVANVPPPDGAVRPEK